MSIDPNTSEIKRLCEQLIDCKIDINFIITLKNDKKDTGAINDCNIIGNCIENILYPYINNSIPTFMKGSPGQKPDYHNNGWHWELKCFKQSPSFDIGSISGYIKDISKLDGIENKMKVKYLVFEYKENEYGGITIVKFWMLSVCDLCCGYTGNKPINIGGQNGVNIRPSGKSAWTNEKTKIKRNPTNFLDRIEKLIQTDFYKETEDEKLKKLESIQKQRKFIGI